MKLIGISKNFITKEESGKRIGLFRIYSSLLGGLVVAYLSMVLLAILLPIPKSESLVISLYLVVFVWPCCILWISLSYSKLGAFLRFCLPTLIFSVLIYILY